MEISQVIGSIYNFVNKQNLKAKIYYDELPETLAIPSMYFPLPEDIIPRTKTLTTYSTLNLLYIQIFEKSSREAMSKAMNIVEALYDNRSKVPIINVDGSLRGGNISIKSAEAKKLDKGVAQVYIEWESEKYYPDVKINNKEYILKFFIGGILKNVQ